MEKQLIIHPERCIDCRTCTLVCAMRHFGRFDPSLSAVTVFNFTAERVNVPVMCLQCDDPACVNACSSQALVRLENGLVKLIANRCIGCKFCVQACPNGMVIHAPQYDRVLKCDLCDGAALCAALCPPQAIEYTDVPVDEGRRSAVAEGLKVVALNNQQVSGHEGALAYQGVNTCR